MLALRRCSLVQLSRSSRALAGPAKVHECDVEAIHGTSSVARAEPMKEMGVLYQPGQPSPLEGTLSIETIVVDGLVAQTGGGSLGSPKQMIKLSPHDPTPTVCKYTGLRFVSKQALEHAARTGK